MLPRRGSNHEWTPINTNYVSVLVLLLFSLPPPPHPRSRDRTTWGLVSYDYLWFPRLPGASSGGPERKPSKAWTPSPSDRLHFENATVRKNGKGCHPIAAAGGQFELAGRAGAMVLRTFFENSGPRRVRALGLQHCLFSAPPQVGSDFGFPARPARFHPWLFESCRRSCAHLWVRLER
jgi:hypothetical protein